MGPVENHGGDAGKASQSVSGWGPAFTAPAQRDGSGPFPPPLQAHYSLEAGQSQKSGNGVCPPHSSQPRREGSLVPAFFLTPFLPIWHLQGETAAPQK